MANIKSIENEKKEIIRNFKPSEMEAYIKSLITILYESFLEQDLEKCSSAKRLIEEATSIYEAEGYVNSLGKELEFRLAKANELLIESVEENTKTKVELSKIIVDNAYYNNILKIYHDNSILKTLIEAYEEKPSEKLASLSKEILFKVESNLVGIKYLLEEKEITENKLYAEELEIIKNEYSNFKILAEKINNF